MGFLPVGPKLTRRVIRETGLDIVRVLGGGNGRFPFVTRDHQHGTWDKRTGEHEMEPNAMHSTSCGLLFRADGTFDEAAHTALEVERLAYARNWPTLTGRARELAEGGMGLIEAWRQAVEEMREDQT